MAWRRSARHRRRRAGRRLPRPAGAWKRASTSSPTRSTRCAERKGPASRAGDRRRPGARLVRGAAARRDLHRPTDRRRPRPRARQQPTSSSTRRSPRRSATSRWKRWPAACRSSPRSRPARPTWSATARPARWSSPATSKRFADALEAYARDPELCAAHGEAGLAFAETMDWDEINAAVLNVYQRVIETPRTARPADRPP